MNRRRPRTIISWPVLVACAVTLAVVAWGVAKRGLPRANVTPRGRGIAVSERAVARDAPKVAKSGPPRPEPPDTHRSLESRRRYSDEPSPIVGPPGYQGKLVARRVRYFPEKLLALTFDDGPDPQITPRILTTLEEHNAHATFFVRGDNAERHPELVEAILAGGHEIGNHTYSHSLPTSPARAAEELTKTEEVIQRLTGRLPCLFRPPGGVTKTEVTRQALRRGYAVVTWTISSADTRPIGPEVIASNVIHTPNPGDIVIMHDGQGHSATADALPQILEALADTGYRFVTLPELMEAWDGWLAEPSAHASSSRKRQAVHSIR